MANANGPCYLSACMEPLRLRAATTADQNFVADLAAACIKSYAEQTWGSWDGRADLKLGQDQIIQSAGEDIGLLSVERRPGTWFLSRLYIAPAHQRRGIGSRMLRALLNEARDVGASVRLTVLEVNPARALYERHGFGLVATNPPRHLMEWRAAAFGPKDS